MESTCDISMVLKLPDGYTRIGISQEPVSNPF